MAKSASKKSSVSASAVQKVKPTRTYSIDCGKPAEQGVFDVPGLAQYLSDKIKVNNKAGVLGDKVSISVAGNLVKVRVKGDFSKRYLKYLTKKFLKKNTIRDYLRVVAVNKMAYELKYFSVQESDDESDESE